MKLTRIALATGAVIGARQAVQGMKEVGFDGVLGTVGLERRRSAIDKLLPAVGWLGLGTVVGAGAALLLAPSSGKELRKRASERIGEAKEEVLQQVDREMRTLESRTREAAGGGGN